MSEDQAFAFLIDPCATKTRIYIVAHADGEPRIPKPSELYAHYTVSRGKLTVVRDDYEAIGQPDIYDALMQEIENNEGNVKSQTYLISDDWLSDYMNGQIDD